MVIPLRDDNPTTTKPVVTLVIIAACVWAFFAMQPRGNPSAEQVFLLEQAAIPCEVTHGQPLSNELSTTCDGRPIFGGLAPGVEPFPDKNVYLAMLTSMFLHGSILHLGGNMLFLWIFGNNIEDRFGKFGFAAFYLVTGIISAGAHIATQADSTIPVIGASGAIAGVMGAYLVFFPRATVLTGVFIVIFFQFVHLPAFVVLIGWFVMQFFTNPNEGVAVMAHIGGFVAGAGIAVVVRALLGPPAPPEPEWGTGYNPYR